MDHDEVSSRPPQKKKIGRPCVKPSGSPLTRREEKERAKEKREKAAKRAHQLRLGAARQRRYMAKKRAAAATSNEPTQLSESTASTNASSTLPLTQKHLQLHNNRLSIIGAQEWDDNDDTLSCASAVASPPGTVSDPPLDDQKEAATSPSVPLPGTTVTVKPVLVQNSQSQRFAETRTSQGSHHAPPPSSLSRLAIGAPLTPTLVDHRGRTTPGLPRLDKYAIQQQTPTVLPCHATSPLDPNEDQQPTVAVDESSHAKNSASSLSHGQKARLSFSSAPSRSSLYESAVSDNAVVDSKMGAFRIDGADEEVESTLSNRVQELCHSPVRQGVSTLFQDVFFGVHDESQVDIWQPTTDTILHRQALLLLEEDDADEESVSACWTDWLVSCLLLAYFVPWLFAVHTWLSQQVVVVGSVDVSLPIDAFPVAVASASREKFYCISRIDSPLQLCLPYSWEDGIE